MSGWQDFEDSAPDLAAAGRRLFVGSDGIAIAFIATAAPGGLPHLSPVCPIFARRGIYLSASASSPKRRDLSDGGSYVLHAFLGENDEELQIAGHAREVTAPYERTAVHEAIEFGSFGRNDPIFELLVERCLWCWWENAGQPDTRPVKRRWRAGK